MEFKTNRGFRNLEKLTFRPKSNVVARCKIWVRGGRKTCQGEVPKRFLASYKRPSTPKKNYKISIFFSDSVSGAMPKSGSAGRCEIRNRHGCVLGRKNRRESEDTPWGLLKTRFGGGSEQFGAIWSRVLARGGNSLCHIFKVKKMKKSIFQTKIESRWRCEIWVREVEKLL